MRLHVLPLAWADLGHRHACPDVWPTLAAAPLSTASLGLGEADILAYDWGHQELWLKPETAQRLHGTGQDSLLRPAPGLAFVIALDSERMRPRGDDGRAGARPID